MKNIGIIVIILSILCISSSNAGHLTNQSNSQALRIHEFRLGGLISRFQTETIPQSTTPTIIKDTSKPNTKIRNIMDKIGKSEKAGFNRKDISKKLDYIPKLISYSYTKRSITTEKVKGYDLGTIPEKNYEKREAFLPKIYTILKRFKKDLNLYHNDILYRNFVYDPKKDKLYIIDFESVSIERTSFDKKDYIELKIDEMKKKSKKKTKKKTKKNK